MPLRLSDERFVEVKAVPGGQWDVFGLPDGRGCFGVSRGILGVLEGVREAEGDVLLSFLINFLQFEKVTNETRDIF